MKKVRKKDLIDLIALFYSNYVSSFPMRDIINGKTAVEISVDSICIIINDYTKFDSESDRRAGMTKFAEQIEAITFGNLKVTSKQCDFKMRQSSMYIANAYEVVD